MNSYKTLASYMMKPETRAHLKTLYGGGEELLQKQSDRYAALLKMHEETFHSDGKIAFFSAPGRTEIGGNHTDHNNGRVLAASVNLDILCVAGLRDDMTVRFFSEGRRPITMDLNTLDARESEKGTTVALIRGVAAGMKDAGYQIGGFDAVVTSDVASGGGLSSSAAIEIMLTAVFDGLYNRFDMPYVLRAQIGKRAENEYFGKPSGLLDQMASAAGGLVTIDFKDTADPVIRDLSFDFAKEGYALAVVKTGGSHADLTDQYAAIPAEMKQVAGFFGRNVLRDVTENELTGHMDELRARFSDRAIMRAFHFIRENDRVPEQVSALEENRTGDFLRLICDSGRSSFMYLQNVYADNRDQSLSLALCIAETLLKDRGAWRVHGGGFAGTTLNFVPLDMVDEFAETMNRAFGKDACIILNIRPSGADMIGL